MLSISKAMSSSAAASYFSQEDYYLKDGASSEWLGKGAADLELSGVVEKEAFLTITSGVDPRTGEKIVADKITKDPETGEQIETHRGGNDLTFSAPKSVSIAYAADVEGIKEAHDNAVKATIEHLQNNYSQYRSPDGIQIADNIIVAKFDHATSRAIDPQIHSHCFVVNAVKDKNGDWKANEPLNVFKDKIKLGTLYRQELMNELQKQGFQVDFTDREQMLFEIRGVDQNTIETFSQRREQVENQVKEWEESGRFRNVSEAELYAMAALKTRDAKDASIKKKDVHRIWKEGFEKAGTTAQDIKNNVEATKTQEKAAPEQQTAAWIIEQASKILTEREAVIDQSQMLDTAAKISGGQHGIKELVGAMEEGTIKLGEVKGRSFCTTQHMKDLEARNLETAKGLSDTFESITSKEEVGGYLSKLEKTEGIKLNDGQKAFITNELCGCHGVAMAQGDPGTGKTFVSSIVERFNAEVLQPTVEWTP